MIGFWATLSLNIPDFSRYAVSQRDQFLGQAIGLPLTMALYSFIGVAVTSATSIIYGQKIWDPVDVLARFNNPLVLVIALIGLCIATLATNIAANVVSPANDFAHLAPRYISFRMGGLVTGLIGVLMMPWKLVADPKGYIFTWLIAYSALLGPIGGILIADYFVWRRRQLNVHALYQANGDYRFTRGFSIVALIALAIGILPSVPGFLVQIEALAAEKVAPSLVSLYSYAWFIGFAIAFVAYLAGRKITAFAPPTIALDQTQATIR
jgi:NCS1 family nucleobase:cation symporter-1